MPKPELTNLDRAGIIEFALLPFNDRGTLLDDASDTPYVERFYSQHPSTIAGKETLFSSLFLYFF